MSAIDCNIYLIAGGKVAAFVLDISHINVRRFMSGGGMEDDPSQVPPDLPLVSLQDLEAVLRPPDPPAGQPACGVRRGLQTADC